MSSPSIVAVTAVGGSCIAFGATNGTTFTLALTPVAAVTSVISTQVEVLQPADCQLCESAHGVHASGVGAGGAGGRGGGAGIGGVPGF